MTDANDFLMSGGVPTAKFPQIGASVTGTICRPPEVQQQRDFDSGDLKYWDDGKPMQQIQVTLATDQRDPEIVDDDGTRAVYVKGNLKNAVRDAVRQAGAPGLQVGGRLTVTYTGDGEAKRKGMSPPKIYSASYVPAPAAAANDFLNSGEPAPQPAVAAPAPAPAAPAPAPAPAPANVPPEALAALAQLTPEQKAALGLS